MKYIVSPLLKMAKTIKDLDSKVSELKSLFNSELGNIRDEISKVKTPVREEGEVSIDDVERRFEFFKAEMENRLRNLERQIGSLRRETEASQVSMDNMIQHGNKNKLLLMGVKENSGEKNLHLEVTKVINSYLKLNINDNNIQDCYRIGKKSDKNTRPILVELCTVRLRNEVFYNKKLMKGSGIIVAEALSPIRRNTYKLVKQKMGKACWTNRGRIGFKHNGSVKYVTSLQQFYSAVGEAPQANSGNASQTDP